MEKIGRYTIKSLVSDSGVGRVYLATDELIDATVAIKVIRVSNSVDREQLLTSLRAAATTRVLNHPGIAKVFEYGEHDGRLPYLVMEHLEGKTLDQIIESGAPMDFFRKVSLMKEMAEALQYAHLNGALHGKLNPSNILILENGTAKILNLGIAGLLRDSSEKRNELRRLMVTLAYKSPEQFETNQADRSSDVFSYGVICHELLTFQHPFRPRGSKDIAVLLQNILTKEPPPICASVPECPASLEKIVLKAIHRSSQHRYPSFADVLADLNPVFLQVQNDVAEAAVTEAEALISRGRLDEARTVVLDTISSRATSESLDRVRRKIQDRLQTPAAREDCARMLRDGKDFLETGDLPSAIQSFEEALRIDSLETEALGLLRRAEALNGYMRRAQGLFAGAQRAAGKRDMSAAAQLAEQGLTATVDLFSAGQLLCPKPEQIHALMDAFRKTPPSAS